MRFKITKDHVNDAKRAEEIIELAVYDELIQWNWLSQPYAEVCGDLLWFGDEFSTKRVKLPQPLLKLMEAFDKGKIKWKKPVFYTILTK